jgi:hypothetical protein
MLIGWKEVRIAGRGGVMMQRFHIFVFLMLCVVASFSGCSNPRQVMVNPDTWQQTVCSESGFGWIGASKADAKFNACVFNQRILGMVPLEEVEAEDAPKFELPLEAAGTQAVRPEWLAGYAWEYEVSSGGSNRLTVQKTETYHNVAGYRVIRADGKEAFYDQSLGLVALFGRGIVDSDYDSAFHRFDFPLYVGKRWNVSGEMRRSRESMDLSARYEVMGYGKVKVPAGEFDAYYILGRSDLGARINELWYSPDVKNYVKGVLYTKKGKIVEELVRFKAGNKQH